MAYSGRFFDIPGLVAGADLSAKQYFAVKLASTAGQVVLATSGTDTPIGLLQNDPTSGQPALVACLGVAKGSVEAAITKGAFLTSNTTGQLQSTTTANDDIIGILLETSTAASDIVPVLLSGPSNY